MSKKKGPAEPLAKSADKHVLYQEAVQNSKKEVRFFEKVFHLKRNRKPILMREDFCGTALICADWVKGDPERKAIGVDLDPSHLQWGRDHNLAQIGSAAERVKLVCRNVFDLLPPEKKAVQQGSSATIPALNDLSLPSPIQPQQPENDANQSTTPSPSPPTDTLTPAENKQVHLPLSDIICAYNFAMSYFHTRADLLRYMKMAHSTLKPDGLLFLDLFGGTDAIQKSTRPKKLSNGVTYYFEQKSYNVFTNRTHCTISFKMSDGSKLKDCFEYDFRIWTLPELREALLDSGFKRIWVWFPQESEDGDDEPVYEESTSAENTEHWNCYIIAGVRSQFEFVFCFSPTPIADLLLSSLLELI